MMSQGDKAKTRFLSGHSEASRKKSETVHLIAVSDQSKTQITIPINSAYILISNGSLSDYSVVSH
ncbi:hypothetical protein [Secundilactobacillus collinoides]|nr:hypothetical protein [Secundilactobacillus collinoides]